MNRAQFILSSFYENVDTLIKAMSKDYLSDEQRRKIHSMSKKEKVAMLKKIADDALREEPNSASMRRIKGYLERVY